MILRPIYYAHATPKSTVGVADVVAVIDHETYPFWCSSGYTYGL